MLRRDFVKSALGAGALSRATASPADAGHAVDSVSANSTAKKKPRIMFYHDSRHVLIYRYEPPMQKEEVEAAVDELVGTPVAALMFCLGDGRTVFHDTRVGELWGQNVQKWPVLLARQHSGRAHSTISTSKEAI